ncbi:MAG: hypothetical protein HKO68_16860 [Desulfobacterales bacterium]|nr:hypothetical protein [Desulfobacterales bacterium]
MKAFDNLFLKIKTQIDIVVNLGFFEYFTERAIYLYLLILLLSIGGSGGNRT